jgi:hypothetical protein
MQGLRGAVKSMAVMGKQSSSRRCDDKLADARIVS